MATNVSFARTIINCITSAHNLIDNLVNGSFLVARTSDNVFIISWYVAAQHRWRFFRLFKRKWKNKINFMCNLSEWWMKVANWKLPGILMRRKVFAKRSADCLCQSIRTICHRQQISNSAHSSRANAIDICRFSLHASLQHSNFPCQLPTNHLIWREATKNSNK